MKLDQAGFIDIGASLSVAAQEVREGRNMDQEVVHHEQIGNA